MASSAPTTPQLFKRNPGTPGSWTHPKYQEIVQRKNARTFTDKQFYQLMRNTGALIVSFLLSWWFSRSDWLTGSLPTTSFFLQVYNAISWSIFALRCLFLYNILEAIGRLFRPIDPVTDIPLTPTQRATFGLQPTQPNSTNTPLSGNASAGDSSMYVTPPRYAKASPVNSPSTPLSASRMGKSKVMANGSPVGPGQNALSGTVPSSSSSSSNVMNTLPGAFGASTSGMMSIGSASTYRGLASTERRSSFGSPTPKTIGMGVGGLGGLGAGSVQGSAQGGSPSVVAGGKWLFEQRNRRGQYL